MNRALSAIPSMRPPHGGCGLRDMERGRSVWHIIWKAARCQFLQQTTPSNIYDILQSTDSPRCLPLKFIANQSTSLHLYRPWSSRSTQHVQLQQVTTSHPKFKLSSFAKVHPGRILYGHRRPARHRRCLNLLVCIYKV